MEFFKLGGGGGAGRVGLFAFLTMHSWSPPHHFHSGCRLCVLFLLQTFSYFSRLPPPWVSHLPPRLLLLPVDVPPPLLPGCRPCSPQVCTLPDSHIRFLCTIIGLSVFFAPSRNVGCRKSSASDPSSFCS